MLQWWLQSRWGSSFSFMGCELEHGHQQDGTLCGFTTVNMLAYESLGSKPLWNVLQCTSYRIQWFNILMKEQKEEKNEPPASSVDNSAELRRPTSLGQPHSPMLIEMPPIADMSSSKRILGGFGAAAMEDNEDIFEDYKLAKNTPAYDMLVDEQSSGAASSPPLSLPASSRPTTRCLSLARDDEIASNEDKDYNVAIMIEDDRETPAKPAVANNIHPFFAVAKECLGKKRAKEDGEDDGDVDENHRINSEIKAGQFIPNKKRMFEFKRKIRELDSHAEFHATDCHFVRHSKCGESKKMCTAYDTK
ncbi:hypothetical protein B0H34DRAFT_824654 [Crassisporium funariophilum]|nr:hypothetical protein B0H34DRAFT_824654 [Crassisporium funariophilum]